MADVLSQSEIDNLLAQLSSGGLDTDSLQEDTGKKVKDYDFRRPAKFSKEHLRTLETIFEHYGRLLSTTLPVYLRKNIQVTVESSETLTFSEFTNSLSNPVIMGIVSFDPVSGPSMGNIIIDMSPALGFAMIDRMLGGGGVPLDRNREFTEIELSILEKILVISTQQLKEPFRNVVDIAPILNRLETNPQFVQIIAPSDMVAIVSLNLKIGDVQGFMNVCLPYFTLEPIIDRLNTRFWYSNLQEQRDEDYEVKVEALLKRVTVPIRAVLGKSVITVTDFTNLQAGDVIRLDTTVDSELPVYVGDIKKFTALPGSAKDNYAVRVASVVREGVDVDG